MRKRGIVQMLARESGVSAAEAADRLDRVVRQILADLRRCKESPLPGIGKFTLGPDGQLSFRQDPK